MTAPPIPKRPRLLLLSPHLGGGGAETVIAQLAHSLPEAKYEVHLGLITQPASAAEGFPAGVAVHGLAAKRVRSAALPLVRLIRRIRPAVVLASMFHLNFLVLLLRPLFPAGTRVVLRHNGVLAASLAASSARDKLPAYTRLLYQRLYPRADRIICQSEAMAEELAAALGIEPSRLVVVPNPVDVEAIRARVASLPNAWRGVQSGAGPNLLAVGRLAREKGFDLLLEAFAVVRERHPLAALVIAGSGPEQQALAALCRQLHMETAVCFAGYVREPWAFYPGATLFVLPSRHDAMPNALLEAAAAGLPLVATPASPGVVALLREQPGVWIASAASSEALAAALLAALETLRPGQRSHHAFIDANRKDRALAHYESVLDAVLEHPHAGRRS